MNGGGGSSGAGGTDYGTQAGRSAVLSIANDSMTAVTFTVETYDTASSITVPGTQMVVNVTGKYIITAKASFAPNATGYRQASIRLDGTAIAQQNAVATVTYYSVMSIACVYLLTAGQTLDLGVFQNSGGALDLDSDVSLAFHRITRGG